MDKLHNTQALETVYSRMLRLNLRQITLCGTNRKSGNSELALAIAKRAAESGKHVLLVELSHYSPCLHERLNLVRNEWLPLTGHWEHAAQATQYSGLVLLSCPEKSIHCVEFKDQETLKAFFDSCEQRFDLVICDAAPLLASKKTFEDDLIIREEAICVDSLCAASKATLLTIISGVTTETQINESNEILKQTGAVLAGVIMNDCFTPSLQQELIRESHRLDRFFPNWMEKIRQRLSRMVLLNQEL
ncbi:tyrosine-protein kinase family protein [Neptunomonas japonica]|uniref:tyrosine-protein kinase family protein n=1 Tax=Neptunomonas japonica TaxID=417574 RepID=UPI0003FD97A3|nr:tyrosine-protein kinase family protein [Neptunomonas japonica]